MNYKSTKFIQTSFVLIVSTVLAGLKIIDPVSYVAVTTLALGNYAHHDVKQKGVKLL